jgi:predicted esterase
VSVAQAKTLKVPVFFAYANDDSLIEPPIFHELADIVRASHAKNRVVEYQKGGHNIQKTNVEDLVKQVDSWVDTLA